MRPIGIARDEKVARLHADILAENRAMQEFYEKPGFRIERGLTDPTVEVEPALA